MHLPSGTILAKDFRIERVLGEGGMGAVYVTEQLSTGKARALKTMRPELVADKALRERFVQEARVGARIDSDHVVEVVAAGIDEERGIPWLAMELLKGATLLETVTREGPLEASRARHVLMQLGSALAAAHVAGVVHRDLKPENLFLTTTRRTDLPFVLKVLDFGIAKLVADGGRASTASLGTPLWMAPEQTEAHAEVSPATDVWAYGLIAFFVLSGRTFWRGADQASVAALLRQVVIEPIPPATERARELGAASLPEGFDAWFARCVARSPADRFADGGAAKSALEPLLASLSTARDLGVAKTQPVVALGSGDVALEAAKAPQASPAGVRVRYVGLAAALLAAGGFALWMATSGSPSHAAGTQTAPGPISPPSSSAEVQPAPASMVHAEQPKTGALFASTPIELRWSADTDAEHEVEIGKVSGSPVSSKLPVGISYVLWPWSGGDASPGHYRWRVKRTNERGWSPWSTFAVYPSVLDRVVEDKALRVGMELTFHEPFCYWDVEQQKLVGFDVDLANAIADALGVKMDRITREWKPLFEDVKARNLDVAISVITVTKERETEWAFSRPYMHSGIVVTARTGVDVVAPGAGKRIGAQKGTTAVAAARKAFPTATVKEYDTLDSTFAALSSGEIDALACDEPVARTRREIAEGRTHITGKRLTEDDYAVMMPFGDTRMKARIDAVIGELESSGRLAAMKTKYRL
jgi:serine/threonine protein kinase